MQIYSRPKTHFERMCTAMAMIKQYQKKNGEKAWYFKTYLGVDPLTGKKRYTTKRGFRTQKEAKIALARLEVSIKTNGLPQKTKSTTFKEVYEMWLSSYAHTVTESTLSRTRIIFNKHVLPKFGDIQIEKIDTIYCQKITNEWYEKGSSKQYPLFINYIGKVFQLAINLGITTNNPAANVIIPRQKKAKTEKKLNFYTKEQLELFLATIEQEEVKFIRVRDYALFRLLAFSGCRIGEILALNWSDINFDTNTLTINKTIAKSNKYYVSETPKTKKSNRKIILDSKTLHHLKTWKLEQKKFLFSLGYNQPKFIFTNESNGFSINQTVSDRLKVYQSRAPLHNIGLHGFRHTHASILYNAGATDKEVSERLGHSNIKTTMDTYTHLSDDQKEKTTDKLMNYINF